MNTNTTPLLLATRSMLLTIACLLMVSCQTKHEPDAPIDPIVPVTLQAAIANWTNGNAASASSPAARVQYRDQDNYLHCSWTIGDTIDFVPDSEKVTATFTVRAINAEGVATLTLHSGYFDGGNGGTFTYRPDAGTANTQSTNGSTAHLKYGEVLQATGYDETCLVFTHTQSAIYKLVFHAPEAWSAGEATIGMVGAWQTNDAFLRLNFAAAAGDLITAYLIFPGGTVPHGQTLLYMLDIRDNEYTIALTPSQDVTYTNGHFWTADLQDKTPGTPRWKVNTGNVFADLQWAKQNLGASLPYEKGSLLYQSENGLSIDNQQWQLPTDGWRLPTLAELEALTACQWRWTSHYKGHAAAGYIVSGNTTGKKGQYIFLPETGTGKIDSWQDDANGYYWASTPDVNESGAYYALLCKTPPYEGDGPVELFSSESGARLAARLVKSLTQQ